MSAISVENVSKRFRIPHEKRTTLLQSVIGIIKRQFDYEEFWALKDISFEIKRGESFGVIGKNGSGKSTLLKILAKVLYPENGKISIDGKVTSFLELGIGFQMELTAQENIYLYSSILGMSRRQTSKIYENILDFAELKKFENMKLKNFSSGMYARLAFSTAVNVDPEILLMDEVFAVGDESFYRKSVDKIHEIKNRGITIVFVSHSLDVIKEFCSKAMLLDSGKSIVTGSPEKVVEKYMSMI